MEKRNKKRKTVKKNDTKGGMKIGSKKLCMKKYLLFVRFTLLNIF